MFWLGAILGIFAYNLHHRVSPRARHTLGLAGCVGALLGVNAVVVSLSDEGPKHLHDGLPWVGFFLGLSLGFLGRAAFVRLTRTSPIDGTEVDESESGQSRQRPAPSMSHPFESRSIGGSEK